ncbi:MAG: putative DNA binding domain-containing protein, partial [Desulfobacterales bacterium]|nr:putative DNA binding domain-containing protein [Desulfobacterales bacterium]
MTKEELLHKINDLEWEDFEVKSGQKEIPKNVWETVSAFSNTSGGWIILGVSESKGRFDIIGVENVEKLEQNFTTTLRGEKFNHKITPKCERFKIDDKTVLAFYIPISSTKPIYFNSIKNTFIRTGSGDQRATPQEIDAMYRDEAFGTRTNQVVKGTSIADINMASLKRYRNYMRQFNPASPYLQLDDEPFLKKLRIISRNQLTYSGLLFIGKEDAVQETFPDFRVDYLEIPGTSYADAKVRYTYRVDEQENLWEYYFTIFDRLRQKIELPFKMTPEGFASGDFPQLEALREALVNL